MRSLGPSTDLHGDLTSGLFQGSMAWMGLAAARDVEASSGALRSCLRYAAPISNLTFSLKRSLDAKTR